MFFTWSVDRPVRVVLGQPQQRAQAVQQGSVQFSLVRKKIDAICIVYIFSILSSVQFSIYIQYILFSIFKRNKYMK